MTNVRCSVAAEMNLSKTAFVRDGMGDRVILGGQAATVSQGELLYGT